MGKTVGYICFYLFRIVLSTFMFCMVFSPRASRSISLKVVVVVVLVLVVVVVSVVTFCKNSQIAVDTASTDGAYQLLYRTTTDSTTVSSIQY